MSTKLAKLEAENKQIRKRNREKLQKEKEQTATIMTEASGQAGEVLSAVSLALLDAKLAPSPGDMAKFGSSPVPIAPVIGLVLGLGSLFLVKAAPAAAAFIGRYGTFAVDMGIYFGVREKAEEWFA
jgi:hypothetical protein